jgi:hypothetical protein
MSTMYSYEQATGLLSDLAANVELRSQLLSDPEATFRKYGFQVDPTQMPAHRKLAKQALLEKSARENRDREEVRQRSVSDLFLFHS